MANIENKMVIKGDTKDAINAFNRLQKTLYVNGQSLENYGQKVSGFFSPALKVTGLVAAASHAANTVLQSEAFKTAEGLNEAMSKVAQGTGAMGKTLDEYRGYVRELYRENPADSYSQIGDALASVQSTTDATGKHLKVLTQQFYSLSQVSGADLPTSVKLCARLFADWNIQTDKQTKTLDELYIASRDTGASVENIAEQAVQFGAKFRILGYSVEETIGLIAKWNKEGVSTEKALAGLGMAVTNLAKKGGDIPTQWRALQSSIRNARSEIEAVNIAVKYFGSKAAPDMAAAIRENRFELGDLLAKLQNSGGAVQKADDTTKTLTERLKELRNTAKDKLLEPLGQEVEKYVAHISDLLTVLVDWAETNDVVKGSVDALLTGLGFSTGSVEDFKSALNKIDVNSLKKNIEKFGAGLKSIYTALLSIAKDIPWDSLIEHADTFTKITVYGWSAGKVLSFGGKIASTTKNFIDLGREMKIVYNWINKFKAAKSIGFSLATGTGEMLILAAEIASIVNSIMKIHDANKSSKEAIAEADHMEQIQKDYTLAIQGNEEALDRLPSKYRQLAEESIKARDVQKENTRETQKQNETLDSELKKLKEMATPAYKNSANFTGGNADAEILAISSAIDDLEKKMQDIRDKGQDAVKHFGVSASDAADVVHDAVEKTAKDIYDTLNKSDPFAASAFVKKMSELGKKSGDQLMTSLAAAMDKKKDLPLESLTGALQSGLITGKGVGEIMKLIHERVKQVQQDTQTATAQQYAGTGISQGTINQISQYNLQKTLSSAGLSMSAPKVNGLNTGNMGGTVTNDNRKQTMNLTLNVNSATTANAKKIGEDMGKGLAKSFDMGIGY